MITTNVLQRTFYIQVGDRGGTCFTIDIEGRQYLITAKHIAKALDGTCVIRIFHERQWKEIEVTVVGHCEGKIDISILAAHIQISPTHKFEASSGNLMYGQDVYFLGFPYGMKGEMGVLNRNFPLPFVKKGIVSCMEFTEDGVQVNYLDGHNNPGFSGGPVIFKPQNSNDYKVASVISAFRHSDEPIYQGKDEIDLSYKYNTGIIISYGIKHAVSLIDANPIGHELCSD